MVSEEHTQLPQDEVVVRARELKKHFPVRQGVFGTLLGAQLWVKAVDGIDLHLRKGEILALAGESGSGKTTAGRLMLRLINPTGGSVEFRGKDITKLTDRELKPLRRSMQIVFQDPYESLDPRMTIKEIIAEPLRVQKVAQTEEEIEARVKEMLAEVELFPPDEFLYRFPHELSGGQRQRVAVARAFVLRPEFVVADEPVSMLDVSIRAEILNLMLDMVKKFGASVIYITHDIALAKHISDRIAVMYLGKVMEMAPAETLVDDSLHPYTQALIAAVPVPDPASKRTGTVISGEIPSPVNIPSGCRFHTRCPYAHSKCMTEEPPLVEIKKDHYVACHLYH